jgi:hypothetical protein
VDAYSPGVHRQHDGALATLALELDAIGNLARKQAAANATTCVIAAPSDWIAAVFKLGFRGLWGRHQLMNMIFTFISQEDKYCTKTVLFKYFKLDSNFI